MTFLCISTNLIFKTLSVISSNRLIDSLKIEALKFQAENNNEIIKQASRTIEYQSELINSFGTIYTILTILIAVIAVGLPIVVYLFGIKPSRDALKQLELTLEDKVADYLIKNRTQQIKKAIRDLEEGNTELKTQAVSYLTLTEHEGFSDQEMFELYRLIKSGKLSETHIGMVASLLGSRVNKFANDIFNDFKYFKNISIRIPAVQYISKVGLDKFMDPILKLFTTTDNQYSEFINLLTFINLNSKLEAIKIFDNKVLIDVLSEETIKTIERTIEDSLKHMNINLDYENTYLNKVIKKTN